jgi:hypothetical protein
MFVENSKSQIPIRQMSDKTKSERPRDEGTGPVLAD